VCQGLLPSRHHFEKREDPGDEVGHIQILRSLFIFMSMLAKQVLE